MKTHMHTTHICDRLYICVNLLLNVKMILLVSVMCQSSSQKKAIKNQIEIHAGQYDNSIF